MHIAFDTGSVERLADSFPEHNFYPFNLYEDSGLTDKNEAHRDIRKDIVYNFIKKNKIDVLYTAIPSTSEWLDDIHVIEEPITEESIRRTLAAEVKPPARKRMACIFIRTDYYTNTWKMFLDVVGETCHVDVDVYLEGDESISHLQGRYDHIVYFTSMRNANVLNDTTRYPKGAWVMLDGAMRKLLEMVTGIYDKEGLSANAREYLGDSYETLSVYECDRILVAGAHQKSELLSDCALLGKVYCISPVIEYYDNIPAHAKTTLGPIAVRNFIAALSHKRFEQNPKQLLDTLKTQVMEANEYALAEAKKLSAAVGFGLSTEYACETVSARTLVSENRGSRPLKVAMITSWNTNCGIAEYTKYFVEQVSADIDFEIWPNKTTENVIDDDLAAPRLWEYCGDVYTLIETLIRIKPPIIHIQCTGAFFTLQGLLDIIETLHKYSKIIVTLHNFSFIKPENNHQRAILNRAFFVVHQANDVNQLCGAGIAMSQITHIPHGQVTVPERTAEEVRHTLKLDEHYPVIGSFGFLLKHKCVYETIEAIALLKKKHPNILYIAANAVSDKDDAKQYFAKCQALIKSLNLENHVKMVPDFLETETALYLLQACDLFALPYAGTAEAASGAVRFCIAARRPLVLTEQPIFADMKDCAVLIKNTRHGSIAKGIEQLLDKPLYAKYQKAVELAAGRHTWPDIEKNYLALYRRCINGFC